jgi:hypothetical protein
VCFRAALRYEDSHAARHVIPSDSERSFGWLAHSQNSKPRLFTEDTRGCGKPFCRVTQFAIVFEDRLPLPKIVSFLELGLIVEKRLDWN